VWIDGFADPEEVRVACVHFGKSLEHGSTDCMPLSLD
jgi:hypothetical protein